MLIQKHSVLIVSLLAAAAIGAALISTFKTSQEFNPPPRQETGYGTVEEAFEFAGKAVKQYVSAQTLAADEPVQIDPVFTSTLLSQAKIWTIKGHAFSPNKKAYEWIVILNYDELGQWQILAKTITPVSREIEDW